MGLEKITNFSTGLLILFALAMFLAFSGMSDKPFYSKGEPREALVAQSMVETNNWILPKRYGDEFATKPPFSHWIAASFAELLGESNELTSRLPSLLMSLISLAAIFTLLSREVSLKVGFATSLILITSIEWHRASITSRVDMTLAGMVLLALYSLYTWERKDFRRYPLLALVGLTGAMLSKGPVGIILPIGICGLHFLLQGRSFWLVLSKLLLIAVPSFFLSLVWYWAAYSKGGEAFLDVVILENFARFQGSMEAGEDPHTHSPLYLYGTLFIGMMPWALAALPAFKNVFSFTVSVLKKFKTPSHLLNQFKTLTAIERFSWIAIIAYLVFFSIPSSKRSVYLLPIYPFASFFIAKALLDQSVAAKKAEVLIRNLTTTLSLLITVMLLSPILSYLKDFLLGLSSKKSEEINFYIDSILFSGSLEHLGYLKFTLILLCSVSVMILSVKMRKIPAPIIPTALGICLLLTIANFSVITGIAKRLSALEWVRSISPTVKERPIFTWREKNYGLNYYLHGKLQVADQPSDIKKPSYIFIKFIEAEQFEETFSGYHIEKTTDSPNPIEKPDRFYHLYKISPP